MYWALSKCYVILFFTQLNFYCLSILCFKHFFKHLSPFEVLQ